MQQHLQKLLGEDKNNTDIAMSASTTSVLPQNEAYLSVDTNENSLTEQNTRNPQENNNTSHPSTFQNIPFATETTGSSHYADIDKFLTSVSSTPASTISTFGMYTSTPQQTGNTLTVPPNIINTPPLILNSSVPPLFQQLNPTAKYVPFMNITLANTNATSKITPTKAITPTSKLFLKPGTIEEEEDHDYSSFEEGRFHYTTDSPLLYKENQQFVVASLNQGTSDGIARIPTCASSLTLVTSGRQDSNRSRFRPGAVRKIRRRAVFKNGDCNILQSRISKHRIRFLQDIFTTLVDTQWRWTLLVFALSFLLSWLAFAVVWWLIAFTHGDFEPNHLPDFQEESNWTPCVSMIHSFTSCFLFSIETQHTIGYGSRATTEECPEAIFVMCLQSIAGVMIQALMVGIVFAKMTRPKHRTQTLLFSKCSVICQRDGQLCLMFRVGDMRKSHIIGASIRAQLIRQRTTKEGEVLSQYQTELVVSADGCDGDLFFIWPMTIVHKIDQDSPLYYLSAGDMLQDRFEIVVILEGTIESTGQTTQARSSYVSSEVLWGHRFEPVVSYNKDRQGYEVDYSKFDNTIQVDTPLCSGADLTEFYSMQEPAEKQGALDNQIQSLFPHTLPMSSIQNHQPVFNEEFSTLIHEEDTNDRLKPSSTLLQNTAHNKNDSTSIRHEDGSATFV